MRVRRTAALLATGALLLVPVAGCGGSRSEPHSAATSPAPGEIAPKTFVADLLAAMKVKSSARMTLSLGTGVSGTADVSYGATTDARISVRYGEGTIQVVTVGGNSYFQQGAGGRFTRVSADDPAVGGFVKQLAFIGPREALGAIAPAIKRVRVQPTPPSGSIVDVKKYWVTVDGSALAQALSFGASDAPKTLDLTFVTADGLLALVTGPLGGQPMTIKITRWGVPVHVTAPPASQVLNR